jgi:hypothetical protein
VYEEAADDLDLMKKRFFESLREEQPCAKKEIIVCARGPSHALRCSEFPIERFDKIARIWEAAAERSKA